MHCVHVSGPSLSELCDLIEINVKPILSVINGFALGGGFEIAISCHYRLATANTVWVAFFF
jgi:3-hydroxyacyl-CoA dehydrogenase